MDFNENARVNVVVACVCGGPVEMVFDLLFLIGIQLLSGIVLGYMILDGLATGGFGVVIVGSLVEVFR